MKLGRSPPASWAPPGAGTGTGTGTAQRRTPAPAHPSRGPSGTHGGPFVAGDAFALAASPRLPGTLQLCRGTWGGLSPDGAAGSRGRRLTGGAAELPPNVSARRPERRHRSKRLDEAEPPGAPRL